jgi:hypothetical protein
VFRIRDPVPFDPWTRDPDPVRGSGMNNPDHISESLEKFVWVKILKFFYVDPGTLMEKIGMRDPG